MKSKLLCAVLLLTALCGAANVSDCKVVHIGPRAVAISCKDGADPAFDPVLSKAVGTTVISCGVADSR